MTDNFPDTKPLSHDWRAVRKVLHDSKPRTRSANISPDEQALRDYFGEVRFRELRLLAGHAAKTRAELGNVILLPGIMGSHLSVTEKGGDEDHIWLNLWRVVKGDMDRLRLKSDGETNTNGEKVHASGVIGWYYARALETLQAEPFPYDWRIDIRKTASRLNDFIANGLGDGTFDKERELHFVAHSMGGLVVRNFIRQHPETWEAAKGRLVMLGTPNMGSFTAVKGLMGKNETANKLARIDLFHSSSELGEIINTFYGLYQLCPDKLANPEVYEASLWTTFKAVLYDDYLQKVPDFHKDLLSDRERTIDAKRMSYIAGIGFETPAALKGITDGGYDFEVTHDGDGTVSHQLGLLEGVTTYYTDAASHADLTNDRTVLQAVKDILLTGETRSLARQKPVVSRARFAAALSVDADDDLKQAEVVARKIREVDLVKSHGTIADGSGRNVSNLDPSLVFVAERKLLRSLLGGDTVPEKEAILPDDDALSTRAIPSKKLVADVRLDVRVMQGSIVNAVAPVIVVGHYKDLPPKGAVGAISRKMGDWIVMAHQNGMIGADLGELFFIPVTGENQLNSAVKSVIIGGMGQVNSFDRDDLRYLVMNVTLGVLGLGYSHVATVLMGTNLKRFTTYRGIRSILNGINDAVERMPQVSKMRLDIHEISRDSFVAANQSLKLISETNEGTEFANLKLNFKASSWKGSESDDPALIITGPEEVTRLTIERTPNKFSLSALVANAAIPKRDIYVQDFIVDSIVEKLRSPKNLNEQLQLGHLLYTMVMPEDFQSYVDTNQSLVLQLDRNAAAIPWELVNFGGRGGKKNFGIDKRVTRQFNMLSAPAPGVGPPLNDDFKVLVIADPAEELGLRLPGARLEGEQLVNFFEGLKDELAGKLNLTCVSRIGHEECDIVDVLSLIANERFDLVHFAGHGTYDPVVDAKSGWVFGRDLTGGLKILSAREIFRLRQVPRLVFANACFSSNLGTIVENPAPMPILQTNRYIAGLAEAFFNRGIENYLGAGWQVDDVLATSFAKAFYRHAILNRRNLSEALGEARKQTRSEIEGLGVGDSTWGAYQFYGDGKAMLVEVPPPRTHSSSGSERVRKTNRTTLGGGQ